MEAQTENIDLNSNDDVKTPGNKENNVMCSVCGDNAAKYKCPKCLTRTCSLACVKSHKTAADCDGVRCKTAFVALSEYNENHMLSDYRLLEETARLCDNGARILQSNPSQLSRYRTQHRNFARNMGIDLKLAPQAFTVHRRNKTFYVYKTKSFVWSLELCFPTVDVKLKNEIHDATTVAEAVEKTCGKFTDSNPVVSPYRNCDGVAVFMRRRDYPSNIEKYHKIDPALTLKEVLVGKTIVDFPRLIIVLDSEAERYLKNVCEEISPHTQQLDKDRGRQNFHRKNSNRKKFNRRNPRAKPYQKNTPKSHQKPNDGPNVQSSSFYNHTAADSFP